MQRSGLGLFAGIMSGAVALVVLALVILFSLDLLANFFDVLIPIMAGVGGSSPGDISTGAGQAFTLLAVVGTLSIPAALLLAALMGGDGGILSRSRPRAPRSGGPPF